MQSLCNQSVTRKMSWSVRRVAGAMINADFPKAHHLALHDTQRDLDRKLATVDISA